MLKFLIILSLTVYVISKIGGFFFRIGAASQPPRRPVAPSPQPDNRKGKKGNVKGGEYIDYEEIK
jgi:hypothetical protein